MKRSIAGLMIAMWIPLSAFGSGYTLGPVVQVDAVGDSNPRDLRSADGVVTWQWGQTIRAFDFDSNRLVIVSSNGNGVYRPDTSGKFVLWTENLWSGSAWYWQVMKYDLRTGTTVQLTSDASQKAYVSVDNGTAVFEKVRSDNHRDIFMAQEPQWSPVPLVQVSTTETYCTPDVSQGRLLYNRVDGYTGFMCVQDLATRQTSWQHASSYMGGVPPRIEGNVVGWVDYSVSGNPLRVVRMDTGEEWLLSAQAFALREDAVAYVDQAARSINLLDLTDGSISVLATNLLDSGVPGGIALDGDRLTWVDYHQATGKYVVLSAEIVPEPATLSLLALGGLALLRRKRASEGQR